MVVRIRLIEVKSLKWLDCRDSLKGVVIGVIGSLVDVRKKVWGKKELRFFLFWLIRKKEGIVIEMEESIGEIDFGGKIRSLFLEIS